jgi:hypothetical protein
MFLACCFLELGTRPVAVSVSRAGFLLDLFWYGARETGPFRKKLRNLRHAPHNGSITACTLTSLDTYVLVCSRTVAGSHAYGPAVTDLCSASLLTPAPKLQFFASLACFSCYTSKEARSKCVWADATSDAPYMVRLKHSRSLGVKACFAGISSQVLVRRGRQQLCSTEMLMSVTRGCAVTIATPMVNTVSQRG